MAFTYASMVRTYSGGERGRQEEEKRKEEEEAEPKPASSLTNDLVRCLVVHVGARALLAVHRLQTL